MAEDDKEISKVHHWIPVGFMKGFSIGFPESLFQAGRDHNIYWGLKGKCEIKIGRAKKHFAKKHLYSYYDSDGARQDKIETILSDHDNYFLNTSRALYTYFFDGYNKQRKKTLPKVIKTSLITFMKIGYKRSLQFMDYLEKSVEEKFP